MCVVSANSQFSTLRQVSFFFFFWSLCHTHKSHRWTDFDDPHVIWCVSALGWDFFLGSRWVSTPLRGSNPQKTIFGVSQRRFDRSPPNLSQLRRILILLTLQPLRFQNFKNPRCRRPPSWKIKKSQYLGSRLSDLRENWHDDAYWLPPPSRC